MVPNAADGAAKEWTYDLRELQLGFGRPDFGPTQRHVLRGWTISVSLPTATDVASFEAFVDGAKGRLNGFWFPEPLRMASVVSAPSTTVVDLARIGLADTWGDDASAHLLFTAPDGTQTIVSVTDAVTDGGNDRVTVSPALPATPTALWRVQRLLYCRLADDAEQADLIAENWQTRSVRVLELPEEYSAIETGEQPVYLYRFFQIIDGDEISWHYTSFLGDIVSGGQTFTAANLRHGTIRRSTRADREEVSIEATFDAGAPWASSLPAPPSFPIRVEIAQAAYATPDVTGILFTGRESGSVQFDGRKVTMKFASWLDSIESRVPHMLFGPRCPFDVFDARTCGVDPSGYEITAEIVRILYQQIILGSVGGSPAADYYAGGRITVGTGDHREIRTILGSTVADDGTMLLTLNARFVWAIEGDGVLIRPGCQKTWSDCVAKFSNTRFGGTPFLPKSNLTFKVADIATTGGKK